MTAQDIVQIIIQNKTYEDLRRALIVLTKRIAEEDAEVIQWAGQQDDLNQD